MKKDDKTKFEEMTLAALKAMTVFMFVILLGKLMTL